MILALAVSSQCTRAKTDDRQQTRVMTIAKLCNVNCNVWLKTNSGKVVVESIIFVL